MKQGEPQSTERPQTSYSTVCVLQGLVVLTELNQYDTVGGQIGLLPTQQSTYLPLLHFFLKRVSSFVHEFNGFYFNVCIHVGRPAACPFFAPAARGSSPGSIPTDERERGGNTMTPEQKQRGQLKASGATRRRQRGTFES